MNDLLHQRRVLVLNRHWLAVDAISPAQAFCHLVTDHASALRIEADGLIEPLAWKAWRELPAPPGVPSVGTPQGRVRVPAVIVLRDYDRVPLLVPSFGLRGLWQRDGGRCQYTGRTLSANEASIDHVIPRSRGGRDGWENCVLADRGVNLRKGARTPEEAGLRLLSPPRVPRPVPASLRIENPHQVPEWRHFLMHDNPA